MSKRYRERNLGVLEYNGKLYDTNFKGEPHEITKDMLRNLREEYGGSSDIEVADRYVRHMRRKYGVFNADGSFAGILGDE